MSSPPRLLRGALPRPPEGADQRLMRALPPLFVLAACGAFFAIGLVIHSAQQATAPLWTPARALPAASVQTGEAAAPPIANLLVTPPPKTSRPRRHAPAVSPAAGASPQASQTGGESAQVGQSAAPSEPPSVEAPSKAPSQAPSPAPSPQPAPSGGQRHSAPEQKSSGSFDSSG